MIALNYKDNPHIIFETLNARGTPLFASDKIKNHILHRANISIGYEEDQNPDDIGRLWRFNDPFWRDEIGRGHQRRPRIDIYLNNWLTLRANREVRAHREFEEFSEYVEKIKKGQAVRDVAADIANLGELYKEIDSARPTTDG